MNQREEIGFQGDLEEKGAGNQFLSLHTKEEGDENTLFLLQNMRHCLL